MQIHKRCWWWPARCRCGERYGDIHVTATRAAAVIERERAEQRLITEVRSIPVEQARRRWQDETRHTNGWNDGIAPAQRNRRGLL